MENTTDIAFLCTRLKELREKNNCTMEDMAQKLAINGVAPHKSSISRVESGKTSDKTLIEMAKKYCQVFGMSETQTEEFMRGERIAIPDTSALLKNSQLIDELNEDRDNSEKQQLIDELETVYDKVVIPTIVLDELDSIKNRNGNTVQSKKAWEIIRGISYGNKIIRMDYTGPEQDINNDRKIIFIAREASEKYSSHVDIITEDSDYSAYLKGDENVSAVHLRDYMKKKQALLNMDRMEYYNSLFLDSYDDIEKPSLEEANGYLRDGNTMIISVVRNNKVTFEQKKKKILWLINCGADIDKKDCSRRYYPPLTHAVQKNDVEMVGFLLKECHANPNVGSRNPHDSGLLRQKNEGNMPLMVAAYHGRESLVRMLCEDERISINQQDSNGYTALMKACMNGYTRCRDVLLEYNPDERIVDINGKTAMDHYNKFLEEGPAEKRFNRGNAYKKPYNNNRKKW